MAIGQRPGDFVGYPVGMPHGIPSPTVGYVGLLDFVGFPVGLSAFVPPQPPTIVSSGYGVLRRKKPVILDDDEVLLILESQKNARKHWKLDE